MITNYTDLQSTIADYLARTDLTSQIPLFVQMAENRLRRDLRIRPMLKVVTTTTAINDPTVAIPSDFLEMRDLHIEANPIHTLIYQNPSNFFRNTKAGSLTGGYPNNYTIMGSEFQFAPIPDAAYTLKMVYYAAPTYLSSTNASNAFLATCPDLLLYASLGEAEPYLMNDARVATWAQLYDRGLNSLTISDDAGEQPSAPMVISVATR
ncbi:hypothetical protein UFOVP89_38 [uncultured Caudovirales phage]|uniref:Uncharacterized protein n=1 Tax=uncultured Caudovirales phage TaxID=2100421 RepID=A0A6J5KYQ3_9CAUD|nr:hypothetical protein UFOVP89_38 [uncultured Caudovirales phage]